MTDRDIDGKKVLALTALLSSRSVGEAAQRAGVPSRTLFRWLHEDDEFQRQYHEAGAQLMEDALMRLQHVCCGAVETLSQIMEDGKVTASSRVSAARATLELALKIEDHRVLVRRMERLEARLKDPTSDEGPQKNDG